MPALTLVRGCLEGAGEAWPRVSETRVESG
jgi:hypothetical protein